MKKGSNEHVTVGVFKYLTNTFDSYFITSLINHPNQKKVLTVNFIDLFFANFN